MNELKPYTMKHSLHRNLLFAGVLSAIAVTTAAFTPGSPANLNADVNGMAVSLSWDWGSSVTSTFTDGFERDDFGDAWTVRKTYTFEPEAGANWMIYAFDNPDESLVHGGTNAALLMYAAYGEEANLSTYHQDEWLMVHPGAGAVYMDFWYWLYPDILEYGQYDEFPDHYYVLISRDNGQTWSQLWDGRYEMGNSDAVQTASLFLGAPADENTVVAFNAVSGAEESLYSSWAVDDVAFFAAGQEAAQAEYRAVNASRFRTPANTASLHRAFTPKGKNATRSHRLNEYAPASDTYCYRVYLDDQLVGDNIKNRQFTDRTVKEPGSHTYRVAAYSATASQDYEGATVSVDIDEFTFDKPRNLVATYSEQSDGKYEIAATWEGPEGKKPDYYVIYVNNKMIGRVDYGDDLSVGQTGIYKGAYTFAVESGYIFPEGVSERIYASVYPGTVPTPENLTAEMDETSLTLKWDAPAVATPKPDHYLVYWGDEMIADDVKTTECAAGDLYPGAYLYSVHAVYSDGTVSLPATVRVDAGNPMSFDLWEYNTDFNAAHLPIGWDMELVDLNETVKDMYNWRFDNWFDIEVPESSGITDGFASISGEAAGMNKLEAYLYSPVFYADESCEAAVITFNKYFDELEPGPSGEAVFQLEYTIDYNENWVKVADLVDKDNGLVTCTLNDVAGTEFQLRWGFLGRKSGVAAIDNVTINDKAAAGVNTVVCAPDSDKIEVYTLDGVRIGSDTKNLPAGIYLIRKNGSVQKRIIR